MENVYKALLMAGAVMIGVFLLYNFTRSMDTTTEFTLSFDKPDNRDKFIAGILNHIILNMQEFNSDTED